MTASNLQPDERVRVTQTIRARNGPWRSTIEGTVLAVVSQPTGSWHAHGKNDKLWLNRLRLKKDDDEIVELILYDDTLVTPIKPGRK
ncbi:MAG: hypothetical protein AABZ08_06425 [Planctomycetota bacterium]